MNINEAYQLVSFISNKVQATNIFSASNFNITAQRSQMAIVERDYRHWQETQDITDALKSILLVVPLQGLNGQYQFPLDYLHTSAVRKIYYQGQGCNTDEVPLEVEVKQIDSAEWGNRISSQLHPPTDRFPVYCEYSTYMEVRPKNPYTLQMDYFRIPPSPVWNYIMVNNRAQYVPTGGLIGNGNSVDFILPDQCHNEICFNILSYVGINISMPLLIQYSEQKTKEGV